MKFLRLGMLEHCRTAENMLIMRLCLMLNFSPNVFITLLYLCLNTSLRVPVCLPAEQSWFYLTHIEYITWHTPPSLTSLVRISLAELCIYGFTREWLQHPEDDKVASIYDSLSPWLHPAISDPYGSIAHLCFLHIN